MKTYSKTLVYKNGNKVVVGENGDHTIVRGILASGIIDRVVNFGPLITHDTAGTTMITHGDFELYVKHDEVSFGVELGRTPRLTEEKNVNRVWYQRISE